MFTRKIRGFISINISRIYGFYLKNIRGIDLGENCNISHRATLDRANPKGVHIGDGTRVMLEALIIAHDYSRGLKGKIWCDTRIGKHCVIGGEGDNSPWSSVRRSCVCCSWECCY